MTSADEKNCSLKKTVFKIILKVVKMFIFKLQID